MTSGARPDAGSFETFFDEHYAEVVRALTLVVGDRDRAEDAAQEAFAQAYRRWGRVAEMQRPLAWVIVVGVHRFKRAIARAERTWPPSAASVADGVGLPDVADQVASNLPLRDALDRLAPRQRATVVLRYLCDLSTDEVADALGCSPGTVKSALHSALRNLRVDLSDRDAIDGGPGEGDLTGGDLLAAGATHDEDGDHHGS